MNSWLPFKPESRKPLRVRSCYLIRSPPLHPLRYLDTDIQYGVLFKLTDAKLQLYSSDYDDATAIKQVLC